MYSASSPGMMKSFLGEGLLFTKCLRYVSCSKMATPGERGGAPCIRMGVDGHNFVFDRFSGQNQILSPL